MKPLKIVSLHIYTSIQLMLLAVSIFGLVPYCHPQIMDLNPSILHFKQAMSLNPPWWKGEWLYRMKLEVIEEAGFEWTLHPFDVPIKVPGGRVSSIDELRLLSWDGGTWVEVPCQAYNPVYDDGFITSFNLVFLGNLSANSKSTYYLYYGNPDAPDPGAVYPTDLNFTDGWMKSPAFVELSNSKISIGIYKDAGGERGGVLTARIKGGRNLLGPDPYPGTRRWYYSHFYKDSWRDNGPIKSWELLGWGPVFLLYRYEADDGDMLRYTTYIWLYSRINYIKAMVIVSNIGKEALLETWHKPCIEHTPPEYDQAAYEVEDRFINRWIEVWNSTSGEGLGVLVDNNPPYNVSSVMVEDWKGGWVGGWRWRFHFGQGLFPIEPKGSLTLGRYFVIVKVGDPLYVRTKELFTLINNKPSFSLGHEERSPTAPSEILPLLISIVSMPESVQTPVLVGPDPEFPISLSARVKIVNRNPLKADVTLNYWVTSIAGREVFRGSERLSIPANAEVERTLAISFEGRLGTYILRCYVRHEAGWSPRVSRTFTVSYLITLRDLVACLALSFAAIAAIALKIKGRRRLRK